MSVRNQSAVTCDLSLLVLKCFIEIYVKLHVFILGVVIIIIVVITSFCQ